MPHSDNPASAPGHADALPGHVPVPSAHLLVAAVVNLVWGFNMVAAKFAVEAVGSIAAGGLRMAVVLLVCLPWLRIVPGRMRALAVIGFVNGVLFLVITNVAIKVADNVGALAVASQLGVPMSLILGVLFLKERIRWPRMIAVALAFGGVVVMGFDPAIVDDRLGLALVALASLVWAIGTLLFRRLVGVPVMTSYAWIAAFSVPAMIAGTLLFEPQDVARIPHMPPIAIGAILFSALGATILGQGGMTWLLQRHSVSVVAPLTLASPLIATVSTVMVFHSVVTAQMVVGGLMTLLGVSIIVIRSARARPEPKP